MQNMSDKAFNNKISLWIKQRLFISKNYTETMNGLEDFVAAMKKSDEIPVIKDEPKQPTEQLNTKTIDDEQRRFGLIVPPLVSKYRICIWSFK